MAYTRACVPLTQQVTLRVLFKDGCGDPKDVDSINDIQVAIYRPDDWDLVNDTEVEIAGSFPNAYDVVDGYGNVTKIGTGFYELAYTLPAGATADDVGNWVDLWVADLEGTEVYQSFTFNVIESGRVTLQSLSNNTLIVVVLADTIADTGGETLQQETQLTYSTKYDPYYASVDLIRAECGPWLDGIPDDTISLMIHWSSLEADTISIGSKRGRIIDEAKTRFVIFDTSIRILRLPADIAGKRKMLGDLLVEADSNFKDVLLEMKELRNEWWRVVNAGGTIVPGQGMPPSHGIRGGGTLEKERVGRLWHDPDKVTYLLPTQNSKFFEHATYSTRKRFGYKRRN